MNRRTAVRNIVIISAGASLLPRCTSSTNESSLHLKNIPLTGSQENMLAELTETIIPKTGNFIGAKDLKSHEFLLTMVDDCASPEEQKIFTDSMNAFEDTCKKKFNATFTACTPGQKNELLKEMETSKEEKDPATGGAAAFYKTVKRYTIESFTSSKEYLLDIRKWKMVPGPDFKGCVPVKA